MRRSNLNLMKTRRETAITDDGAPEGSLQQGSSASRLVEPPLCIRLSGLHPESPLPCTSSSSPPPSPLLGPWRLPRRLAAAMKGRHWAMRRLRPRPSQSLQGTFSDFFYFPFYYFQPLAVSALAAAAAAAAAVIVVSVIALIRLAREVYALLSPPSHIPSSVAAATC